MAKEHDDNFQYDVLEGFDFILEESGNSSINLRKISWNGRPHKLDIRKYAYQNGEERMMKGIGLSEEGANELTGTLVEQGYGDTARLVKAIKKRTGFETAFDDIDMPVEDDSDEDYYDPKQLLNTSFDGDEDE